MPHVFESISVSSLTTPTSTATASAGKKFIFYFYTTYITKTFPPSVMANEMSHLKPTIENLDGTNYQAWKRNIQRVLIKKGVWNYLGEIPEPGYEQEWRRAQQLGVVEVYYYNTSNVFVVFDVDAKKLLKRRDMVFHEDVLSYPSLLQFGLQPGFDSITTTDVQYRTRHIEATYYYITEKVRKGMIVVKYLPTKKMMPDMFTKALPRDTICHHLKK